MKKSLQFLSVGIILIPLFTSCSIEKRRYVSGYNIQWKSSKPDVRKNEFVHNDKSFRAHKAIPVEPSTPDSIIYNEKETATADNSNTLNYHPKKKTGHHPRILPDVCDVLVLKNGDEIKVKAYEISGKEIKYKKCDEVNAPTYTLIKSEVLLIKHPDGTSVSPNASSETENKPTEKEESGIFGILSIACIIGSLICAIFLLGPVLVVGPVIYLEPIILLLIPMAIIFGAIGTGRKRKNRLLAILGLWLGIAAVIALMIISIIDLSHGLGGN